MKSIFLTTCGRCGTIWIKTIVSNVFGFKQELPDMKMFDRQYARIYEYPANVMNNEINSPGNHIYTGHIPMTNMFFLNDFLNIIAMIRDPRDVVVSGAYFNIMKGNLAKEDFKENVLANLYSGHVFTILYSFLGQRNYTPYCIVKYEDMMADALKCASNIFDHFGYEYDQEILKSAIINTQFKNMSEGREAGQENVNHYFRKGVIGDWKNYLTQKENAEFISKHGKLMEEFGYDTSDI